MYSYDSNVPNNVVLIPPVPGIELQKIAVFRGDNATLVPLETNFSG